MRILVDSSTFIALAKIGELQILKDIFGKVSITDVVRKEVLRDDFPETATLKAAMDMWIEIINFEGDAGEFKKIWVGIGRR
jgi:predicted nucleic acid-binding protein